MAVVLYDSKICTCGHWMGDHYKKNYLMSDGSWLYGNVDFLGCDGDRCKCKGFTPSQVPKSIHGFECGFTWIMDNELEDIYSKEIEKKTYFGAWFKKNKKRYFELLQKKVDEQK